jgi:hypothetical protein
VVFDKYRARITTNTLETYLIFLSWVSHIQDIDDDDEKLAQGAALQDFMRDVEHISDKGESKKGSLSVVGNRILVAAYIWLHNDVWEWWDDRRSRVSIKMIASCTVRAITDEFLLGRLFRTLTMNEHKSKAEISDLAKAIVEEDGIAAWDIKKQALTFHVFHCDNWAEATVKQVKERQWIKARTLREHKRWTDICDKRERAIRALTIVSIGAVAKKAGRVDTFEVVFSNKESLWLSHDNIKALDVKQWAGVLDKDVAAPVEEKKDDAKEQPQTLEQRKVVEMEEKLEEEHRLRVQEHQLRIEAENKLQLLLQERAKERAEQQRRQRLQQRDRARETAQLLEKLRGLSARMPNELRHEVLQLVHALQGKQSEEPAEEAKEAPQPQAAAEEVKEAPPAAAEDDAAEDDAAEDDAAEDNAAEDDAAEDDVAAATPPPAIASKRKEVRDTANAGKKQRR